MVRTALAGLCLGLFALGPAAQAAEIIAGRPVVVEGDTLRVHGVVIGLHGIASPGLRQTCEKAAGTASTCGADAARALAEHVGTGTVKCEVRRIDSHRRAIAVCRLGNEDLAAWMVERGFAVADRFEAADYKALEKKAWAKRRGLWAGVFDDPTGRKREDYPSRQANVIPE